MNPNHSADAEPDFSEAPEGADATPESTAPPPPKRRRHRIVQEEIRPLKVRRVSMWHGWYWLIEGFILLARNPAFLFFLSFSLVLVFIATAFIRVEVGNAQRDVGYAIFIVLYPGLFLGVWNGCRAVDRKRKLSPALLVSGFRRRAYDLLLLGFSYFVFMTVLPLLTLPIDGGVVWNLLVSGILPSNQPFPGFLFEPPVSYSGLVFLIPTLLCTMAYLFAPQLIGWWRLPMLKAMSFSFRGCLVNLLPFFIYTCCFCFFLLALPIFLFNFVSSLMEGLSIVACVIYILVVIPAVFASFYVAARDIYGFPRRRRHQHPQPHRSPANSPARKKQALET
ncbi:MAG: hypothetical protein LBG78_10315 [Azoarcus sp.]|jgi:hypothetical protein|nr:hypothetical protein [Azoarcus sp.]